MKYQKSRLNSADLISLIASVAMSIFILTLTGCSGGNTNNDSSNSPPNSYASINYSHAIVNSGDEIYLVGSDSTDYDGQIVSYQWTQLSGASQVVLTNPDEADTTFIAPISLAPESYVFQLEVVDDKGAAATATVDMTIAPSVNCASCTENQINTLYESSTLKGAQYGQLLAIEGSVLAIANQVSNKIEILNLASGNIQKEFQLNSAPDKLYFQSNRRLLYASLLGTTAVAQINIDTDQINTVRISGLIESMTGNDDRVYYLIENQSPRYAVYSIGYRGDEQSHGGINGDLIAYNTNLNEILEADSDSSGGSLNRYRFNASSQLELIQTADPESSGLFGPVPFASNISLSSSGQQMVISSNYGGGFGTRVPIMDIPPGDVQASNGAWLSDAAVVWAEFSATDDHVITVHDSFDREAIAVTVYNSTSKVRLFDKALRTCNGQFNVPVQVGFSKDNRFFYTKIDCESFSHAETNSHIVYTKFPEF